MPSFRTESPGPLLPFLFSSLAGWKHTTVRQRLKHGAVRVNGATITRSDHALAAGDTVEVVEPRNVELGFHTQARIRVLHEDDDVIVIDKPAGLLSVATASENERTALNIISEMLKARDPRGAARGTAEVMAVHRLDRETSGVLMVARSKAAHAWIQAHWSSVEKHYSAIVHGVPDPPAGTIALPLREDDLWRVLVDHAASDARDATTHYSLRRALGAFSRLDLRLETGRKHQIRVHLAAVGHPIAGDNKYGPREPAAPRLALHAMRLKFPHPQGGPDLDITCPWPAALESFERWASRG